MKVYTYKAVIQDVLFLGGLGENKIIYFNDYVKVVSNDSKSTIIPPVTLHIAVIGASSGLK